MEPITRIHPWAPSRRPIAIAASLALLVVLGYGGYWMWAARTLLAGLDQWVEARIASGWSVSHGILGISGFPARIVVRLPDPHVTSPQAEWRGDDLSISVSPFRRSHLRFVVRGDNHLTVNGSEWLLASRVIRAELTFGQGALTDLHMTANDVRLAPSGGSPVTADALGLSVQPIPGGGEPLKPSYTFIATAAGISADTGGTVAPVVMAEAAGQVLGDFSGAPPVKAVSQWSADGGTLKVDRFILDWPPVALEGEGTLAFDPAMQPLAAFSTRMRGLSQLLDGLAKDGVIDATTAQQTRQSMTSQGKPDAKGRMTAPIPVSVQDGKVWLGTSVIGSVPHLNWPQ